VKLKVYKPKRGGGERKLGSNLSEKCVFRGLDVLSQKRCMETNGEKKKNEGGAAPLRARQFLTHLQRRGGKKGENIRNYLVTGGQTSRRKKKKENVQARPSPAERKSAHKKSWDHKGGSE